MAVGKSLVMDFQYTRPHGTKYYSNRGTYRIEEPDGRGEKLLSSGTLIKYGPRNLWGGWTSATATMSYASFQKVEDS